MNDTRCASDTAVLYVHGAPVSAGRREIRLIFTFNRLHRTRRASSENYQSIHAVIYIASFTRGARETAQIKWPPVLPFHIRGNTARLAAGVPYITKVCSDVSSSDRNFSRDTFHAG